MTVTIYHNPRCSKSRQTLNLLYENNIKPNIIEYLKIPPTINELKEILTKLGYIPRDLMRVKEPIYKELDLGSQAKTDTDLITEMLNNPILIERPIVISGDKAILGRPPEAVLNIL
jgi:arsenate reductase